MTIKEQLTKLEQDAHNLVNNLAELREIAGHYRDAKKELNKTNENLIELIMSTQDLAEKSHNIIQILNEIGTSKIFEQLELIKKEQQEEFKRIKDDYIKIKVTYEELGSKMAILKQEIGKFRRIVIIIGIILFLTLLVVIFI